MQVEELLIAEPEAAQALGSVGFLGKFLSPASPSEVARQLGMPANLAHHHVQKFLRLGLLFRVGREKGRVLYQLSARTFKVPERVAEVMDYAKAIHAITDRYLDANERSTARQERENPGWTICSFGGKEQPSAPPQTKPPIAEARPAYLYSRTLPLSPERYPQELHLDS
jgi:predicted DNA-binding transcriptional regulator